MKLSTKNMMKIASMVAFGMLSSISFGQEGQNLVPNPGFEQVGKKPKKLGSIESATGWISPTGVRADLFADVNVPDISTPINIFGKELALEGSNYAGIVAYSYGNKIPRSYILSKLGAPMKKGMKYCVKFNVSLAEGSKYAVNNIAALFTKKHPGTDAKVSIIEEPSLQHFNNDHKIMTARYGWTEICGTFTANGGEKYIVIGNFNSDEETKAERMKKDPRVSVKQIVAAYYYIDDVSVVLLGEDESCECLADDGSDDFSTLIYQKPFNTDDEMTAEEKIELQQLYFAFGKTKLTSEAETSLDLIAAEMQANPDYKLQINGHNNAMEDSIGVENDHYADMDLKRIGKVMEYLKSKGIAEGRMIVTQKGDQDPNSESDEADDNEMMMAKNRRVTFVIRK
ncbi:MAG: OmpA family protein [Crocinitomicaceae bacterium]|nr:OmpA family protein [Crocinitomicaceae bacterium]